MPRGVIDAERRWTPGYRGEAVLLGVILVTLAWFVLGPPRGIVPTRPFLLFPLLLWTGLRFGPVGAALATVTVGAFAVWNAALGQGSFAAAASGKASDGLELGVFLIAAIVSSIISSGAFTNRRAAIAELRHSRERYRNVVETATDAIITIDRGSIIRFANAATGTIFGYAPSELIGQPLSMLMPSDQKQRHEAGLARYVATGKRSIPWQGTALTGRHKDGREIPLEVSFGEFKDGARQEFTGILRDITEKRAGEERVRALEDQHRQSRKMEAIGELAGGIAHDFNNLLMVVQGNTEMLIEEAGADARLRGQLEQVHAAAARAASLTRQLLAFSRRQVLAPRVMSLADSIASIEPMLRRLIGEHVAIAIRVPDAVGPVLADPGQVEQVILNLAINARDAMPGGGELGIELSEEVIDAAGAVALDLPPGRYACLAVSDTGVGMTEDTVSRIFEPFFTTKPTGQGTGLGLSTVHGIIKQSGGGIRVRTRPWSGSTFSVYLPRVDGAVDPPRPAPQVDPAVEAKPAGATILVVEDESDVGRLARRILERAGYRVLLATSPAAAMDLAAQEAEIALLLSDVVLPEMSGRAMAERLAAAHPAMKVLYMSGYTDDVLSHLGVLDDGIDLLEKPFRPAALLARVASMLGTQGLK